jgi:hypothetical protein
LPITLRCRLGKCDARMRVAEGMLA